MTVISSKACSFVSTINLLPKSCHWIYDSKPFASVSISWIAVSDWEWKNIHEWMLHISNNNSKWNYDFHSIHSSLYLLLYDAQLKFVVNNFAFCFFVLLEFSLCVIICTDGEMFIAKISLHWCSVAYSEKWEGSFFL